MACMLMDASKLDRVIRVSGQVPIMTLAQEIFEAKGTKFRMLGSRGERER